MHPPWEQLQRGGGAGSIAAHALAATRGKPPAHLALLHSLEVLLQSRPLPARLTQRVLPSREAHAAQLAHRHANGGQAGRAHWQGARWQSAGRASAGQRGGHTCASRSWPWSLSTSLHLVSSCPCSRASATFCERSPAAAAAGGPYAVACVDEGAELGGVVFWALSTHTSLVAVLRPQR
jgi:hypothetical protein